MTTYLDGDPIVLLRWRDCVTLNGPPVAFGDGAHRLVSSSPTTPDTEPRLPGTR